MKHVHMNRWRPAFLFLASCMAVMLSGALAAQPADVAQKTERIGEYVSDALDELGVPGASLALVYRGELVYARGWGVTGGGRREVTAQTPFLIGSNSKALTAFGIMLLIQNGELHLDDAVQRYLPWFRLNEDGMGPEITIEQLLSHTSGISAYSGFRMSDKVGNNRQQIQAAVRGLAGENPIAEPGQVYEYSAANYAILGALIELVRGISFAEFMATEIFQPLGMTHAAADMQSAQAKGWEPGYRSWFGIPVATDPLFDHAGAPYGYISASAEDMAQFLIALQQPGQVMSAEYSNRLLQPVTATGPRSAYGYGWRVSESTGGETRVWHGGSTSDFRSEVFLLPAAGWGVVLLTNRNNAIEAARLTQVVRGIEAILSSQLPVAIGARTPPERQIFYLLIVLSALSTLGLLMKSRRPGKPGIRLLWLLLAIGFAALTILFLPLLLYATALPWRSFRLFVPDLAVLAILLITLFALNAVLATRIFLRIKTQSTMIIDSSTQP